MADSMHHGGFESRLYGRERRKYTHRYFARTYSRKPYANKKDNGVSMLAKMGICILLAGLVLLSDFMGSKQTLLEVSSDIAKGTEDIGGDYLGKLRFVELPGMIQVFSSDAKLRIDTEYDSWQLNEEKTEMTINGIAGKALASPADGTIKNVSADNEITNLELSMDGDVVLCLSACGESVVEEGQPIKAGDTLFKSIESVEIKVIKSGRPMDPTEYFDMNNANPA